MQDKKSKLHPDNIWFVCDECGTSYDDHMEAIIPEEEIRGTIEWANTPTSTENKWDALDKLNIRIQHEHKKRESKG